MRKLFNLLALVVIAGLIVAPHVLPAIAHHVNEPKNPITNLDLHLENYAQGIPVVCDGVTPFPFAKVRVAMYVTSARMEFGDPSEHFIGGYTVSKQVTNPKTGQPEWKQMSDPQWPHQNVPPHAPGVGKFDVSRLTDEVLEPGVWRITARLTGDESGTVLTDTCSFKVG